MKTLQIRINNIQHSLALYDNVLMITNQASTMHLQIENVMFEDKHKWLVTRDHSVRVHLNDVYEQVKALVEQHEVKANVKDTDTSFSSDADYDLETPNFFSHLDRE